MVRPVAAASILAGDALAALAAAPSAWWDDVDRSEKWQRDIFFGLSAVYAILSIVSLVQLIRIQLRVHQVWSVQKIFHFMNFVVNGLRAILFGLYHSIFLIRTKALEMFLIDLPGLLFFSTYTLLVLFWAEIYQQASGHPRSKFRPAYLIINGIIYLIQVGIWVYILISPGTASVEMAKIFFAGVCFFAAFAFLIFGGRLFILLRNFPIESKSRRKKVNEVGFVTAICCSCFLIRCILVAYSASDKDSDLDVLDHPLLNLIYYTLVEIIPSALVLFILRKLPPKRVSHQYHPIN